jgi:hypothetical protein
MRTFKKEIETILTILSGSQWAAHPDVQEVISEYGHMTEAARTPTQSRRVSLQIFHASRAIDSLLAHIAAHEAGKPGNPAPPKYFTLGSSLRYIKQNGVSGLKFTPATELSIEELTTDRNLYLHKANVFPPDPSIQQFLMRTVLALKEATTFPP